MATKREKDADEYLKEHKIMELMENLTSMLIYHMPEDPKKFLIEQLELLKISRQSGIRGPNLFDSSNVDAVFRILDPANLKFISLAQYTQALVTLGIKDFNTHPEGADENLIACETFRTEAMEGLQRCSATYKQL